MKISTKGRYALRTMIDLAQHNRTEYISVKSISERQGISVKYLEQIISNLNKAGYVKSLRGIGGGYKLAKGPEEITAGEILRAIEGSLSPVSCIDDNPNQCDRAEECLTIGFWEGLNKVVGDYVDNVTIADFLIGKD